MTITIDEYKTLIDIISRNTETERPSRRSPTPNDLRGVYKRDLTVGTDAAWQQVQRHILIKLREDMRRHRHLDVLNLWIEENE